MRQPPSDPLHRPAHISRFVPFGIVVLTAGMLGLVVRLVAIPATSPLIRCGISVAVTAVIFLGFLLLAIGAVRSWGRRLVTGVLVGSVIALLGSATVLVLDAIPAPRAFMAWVEEQAAEAGEDSSETDSAAVEQAEKPIVSNDQSLRRIDAAKYYETWVERHLVEPYNRTATGDAKRDEAAREVIRGAFRLGFQHPNIPPQAQLKQWYSEALGSDGEDPFVLLSSAFWEYDPAVYRATFARVEKQLAERPGTASALFVARLYAWIAETRVNPNQTPPADRVIESLAAAMKESPLDEAEAWAWVEFLCTGHDNKSLPGEFIDPVLAAIKPLTDRNPWVSHYLRGRSHMAAANKLPGYGLHTNDQTLFREHCENACLAFVKGWEMHPQHPGCATEMIFVSTAVGDDPEVERRQWFDRATTAIVDHIDAFDAYRISLSHWWRGSRDAIESLAWVCQESERYDTRLPFEFVRSLQALSHQSTNSEEPFQDSDNWEAGQEIIDQYLKRSDNPEQPGYWASQGAILAYKCGEIADCRKYLEKIGYKVDTSAAEMWGIDAESWSAQMIAELSPARGDINLAKSTEERGEYDKTIQRLSAAIETPDLAAPAKAYLEARRSKVEAFRALQRAAWKPMLANGSLEGWQTAKGKPKIDSKGTVEAKDDLTLVMNEPVGDVFEVRGEIEFEEDGQFEGGGFAIGQPAIDRSDSMRVQLRRFSTGRSSVLCRADRYRMGGFWNSTEAPAKSRFHLRVIGDRCLFTVDGRVVVDRRIEEPSAMAATSRLALLATGDDGGIVRWHSLEWRRP